MGRKLDTLGRGPGVTQAYHRVGGRVEAKTAAGDAPLRRRAWRSMRTPLGIAERAQFDAVRSGRCDMVAECAHGVSQRRR